MKKQLMTLLFGSVLILGACGEQDNEVTEEGIEEVEVTPEESSVDPQQVVQQNCISCHGENLEGQGNFPSLNDVGERLSEEEILEIIENGQGAMPPDIIEGEEAQAVALWLSEQQ